MDDRKKRMALDERRVDPVSDSAGTEMEHCPACDFSELTSELKLDSFEYGVGDKAVQLSALVPIHTCRNCGASFVGEAGMEAREDAIREHLGVLKPRQIVALRTTRGLSQRQFAELTRIGVASLARWEAGTLIQSAAYDEYLRLLLQPVNLERLRQRQSSQAVSLGSETETPKEPQRKFQVLEGGLLDKKRREAVTFRLCA